TKRSLKMLRFWRGKSPKTLQPRGHYWAGFELSIDRATILTSASPSSTTVPPICVGKSHRPWQMRADDSRDQACRVKAVRNAAAERRLGGAAPGDMDRVAVAADLSEADPRRTISPPCCRSPAYPRGGLRSRAIELAAKSWRCLPARLEEITQQCG